MKKTLTLALAAALSLTLAGCMSTPTIRPGEPSPKQQTTTQPATESKPGDTRDNPLPIGTTLETHEWEFTLHSVSLDASAEVTGWLDNPAPAEGERYMMMNITMTYQGDDPKGAMPSPVLEYVTADGNTVKAYDHSLSTPDFFDYAATVYEGASVTGNVLFVVPDATAEQGVFAIRPDSLSEKMFFAVK